MNALRMAIGCLVIVSTSACATLSPQELRQVAASRDLGSMYLQRGQNELAIREYRRALKIDGRDAACHFGVGEAYRRKEAYELAEVHLRKALRYDPMLLEARLNLGVLYLQQEDWSAAIEQNRMLVDDPTFLLPERALVNLGWAEYKSGNLVDAERYLREAVLSNERSIYANLNLAIVLQENGDHVRAVTYLEKVLAILKDRPAESFRETEAQTRFRLAQAYISLGRRERALEHLRVASEQGGASEWGKRSQEYLGVIK